MCSHLGTSQTLWPVTTLLTTAALSGPHINIPGLNCNRLPTEHFFLLEESHSENIRFHLVPLGATQQNMYIDFTCCYSDALTDANLSFFSQHLWLLIETRNFIATCSHPSLFENRGIFLCKAPRAA